MPSQCVSYDARRDETGDPVVICVPTLLERRPSKGVNEVFTLFSVYSLEGWAKPREKCLLQEGPVVLDGRV